MRITKLSLTRGGTAPDPEGCNTLSISFEVSVKADLADIIAQCQAVFGQEIGSWSFTDASTTARSPEPVEAAEKAPANPTSSGETSPSQSGAASTAPTSRRRANRLGEPETGTSAPSATTPAAPTAETAQQPTRRRGATADPASSAAPVAATPTTDVSAQPPAQSVGSRRRAPTAEATTAPAVSPSEPSDQDLSKAASLGARTLTPRVVTEFLQKNFEVQSVGELKGRRRQEFIDLIMEKIAEAK